MNDDNINSQPVYVVEGRPPEVEGAASTALWLEVIFGLFSLLGVGHVYSGRIAIGLVLLFGWWAYMALAAFVSTMTLGVGACICAPLYIAVPIISGIQARTHVRKTESHGSWTSVAYVAGGGCLVIVLIIVAFIALGAAGAVLGEFQ